MIEFAEHTRGDRCSTYNPFCRRLPQMIGGCLFRAVRQAVPKRLKRYDGEGRLLHRLFGALAVSILVTFSAAADPDDSATREAVQAILSAYEEACVADVLAERSNDQKSGPEQLKVPPDAIYEVPYGADDQTATVVYLEFQCGDGVYPWCGTGGCGFYLLVNGQIFQRHVAFRPRPARVPKPNGAYNALIYGVHGTACQTPQQEPGSGASPCYAIAVWDERLETFFTRDTAFVAVAEPKPP